MLLLIFITPLTSTMWFTSHLPQSWDKDAAVIIFLWNLAHFAVEIVMLPWWSFAIPPSVFLDHQIMMVCKMTSWAPSLTAWIIFVPPIAIIMSTSANRLYTEQHLKYLFCNRISMVTALWPLLCDAKFLQIYWLLVSAVMVLESMALF